MRESADAYEEIVSKRVLPSIGARDLAGYQARKILRRDVGDEVECSTILLFD